MGAVIYLGPHTAVELEGGIVARKNKHTDVDDPDLEQRLVARPDFRRAPKPRKSEPDTGDDAGQQEE